MRKYIRHPSNIPIEYDLEEVVAEKREYLNNISKGGLSFQSNRHINTGSLIQIRIPIREPVFEAKGVVVWCRKNNSYYDVGVEFRDLNAGFGLRMVEQVCHIEQYKKDVLKNEGRELSGEEAAIEWITKYAKDFPRD